MTSQTDIELALGIMHIQGGTTKGKPAGN